MRRRLRNSASPTYAPQFLKIFINMWSQLPFELKLAIADSLQVDAVKALASVDRATYNACLPVTFKNVSLDNMKALRGFLDNVPREYSRYIHRLHLSTQHDEDDIESVQAQTETVIALLTSCLCLKDLTLRLDGSLHHSLIACFQRLSDVTRLTIANCSEEHTRPLSERFVVSLCASLPSLSHLSLDRISRSRIHAPELVGAYPYIPLVLNDDSIPLHPTLGSTLSLPSLLGISTLKSLCIRDTHLGDPLWETTPIKCQLQKLDLGAYPGCDEDFNRSCTERIMSALSGGLSTNSLVSLSLTTSLTPSSSVATTSSTPLAATPNPSLISIPSKPSKPKYNLPHLRKLQLSPFFPIDSVVDTMAHLATSPIESVEMQCYEDDVVDVCEALGEFLALRKEKLPKGGKGVIPTPNEPTQGFFDRLQRINIVSVRDPDMFCPGFDSPEDDGEEAERICAIKKLQRVCREARLASSVSKARFSKDFSLEIAGLDLEIEDSSYYSWSGAKWADGRARSMTI